MNIVLRHGMPSVQRSIAAPAERVWDILVDVDAWPTWGPTVERAVLDSGGALELGSRGKIRTPVGVWLPFTVTEFDAGRYWAWEVAGIRATRHEVVPTGNGSRVTFGVPLWAPAYLPVCAVAVRRIANMAG